MQWLEIFHLRTAGRYIHNSPCHLVLHIMFISCSYSVHSMSVPEEQLLKLITKETHIVM